VADWDRHDESKFWWSTATLLFATPISLIVLWVIATWRQQPLAPIWVALPLYFVLPPVIAGVVARRARFTFEGGAQLVMANILCAFVVLVFVIFAIANAVN